MIFNTIAAVPWLCCLQMSRSNSLIIELINGLPRNEQQPATEKPNEVNASLLYAVFPIRISSVYLIIDSACIFIDSARAERVTLYYAITFNLQDSRPLGCEVQGIQYAMKKAN